MEWKAKVSKNAEQLYKTAWKTHGLKDKDVALDIHESALLSRVFDWLVGSLLNLGHSTGLQSRRSRRGWTRYQYLPTRYLSNYVLFNVGLD